MNGINSEQKFVRKFEIVKDEQGFAMAIAVDGWFLIHLQRGTVRNEENAEKLLTVLNAAVVIVNNPAWAGVCDKDAVLDKALQDIMPNAEHNPQAVGSRDFYYHLDLARGCDTCGEDLDAGPCPPDCRSPSWNHWIEKPNATDKTQLQSAPEAGCLVPVCGEKRGPKGDPRQHECDLPMGHVGPHHCHVCWLAWYVLNV